VAVLLCLDEIGIPMRKNLTTLLTVIGAVTVLVLAANTVALATTGKALIAGKTNTSSKITALSRTTSGVPLKITSKSTANAPLAVNGKGKVTNLNADKIDGLSSSSLITKPYVVRKRITIPTSSFFVSAPEKVPPGYYFATYSVSLNTVGSDIGSVRCVLSGTGPGGAAEFVGGAESESDGRSYASVSGSGVVYKPDTDYVLDLQCYTGADALTDVQQPVQVTFTRLNGVTASTEIQQ